MPKTLAIIGAGPKAAAILARAAVLKTVAPNADHPLIRVFEQNEPGSAWRGDAGFTNGMLTLCSPAEKDIGFPYQEVAPKRSMRGPIGPELFRRFSWSAFLVSEGGFAEWIDRGRDYPSHSRWADYVAWVFKELKHPWVKAKVTAIAPAPKAKWRITYLQAGARKSELVDGVVLTGAGEPRRVRVIGDVAPGRIFDAGDVWAARGQLEALRDKSIAIVGDGGAAGAIVAWLAPRLAQNQTAITSISNMGTLLPRGDGYGERRWFTDPSEWRELSEAHRNVLIDHTELGVISLRNKTIIDGVTNVGYAVGRATEVREVLDELAITVTYDPSGGEDVSKTRSFEVVADVLINAIGFDPWSLINVVDPSARGALLDANDAAKQQRVTAMRDVMSDLSLPPSSGLPAGLHVPGLAALAQGPGMPTLGCLGLVAQLVLDGYTF